MKINKNSEIKFLNESLLLSTYIFNSDAENDEMICANPDELSISQETLNHKYQCLSKFLKNTRKSVREIARSNTGLAEIFMLDEAENSPNLIYFMSYGNLSNSIKSYTVAEFHKLYHQEFEDNLISLGDLDEHNDLIKAIDSIKIFNNTQKFTLVKLLQNTNEYFVELYEFISQVEEIIRQNIYLISDLINEISSEIDLNYLENLKDFQAVKNLVKSYKIDEIELSLRVNFYEEFGFSVFEINKKLEGEIYCGLIPYLLKDCRKSRDEEKEEIFNLLKTISDETRFDIILLLNKNKKMYGREIADALNLTTGTVSHHLTKLIAVKILYSEVKGNKIYYSLNDNSANYIANCLRKILGGPNAE